MLVHLKNLVLLFQSKRHNVLLEYCTIIVKFLYTESCRTKKHVISQMPEDNVRNEIQMPEVNVKDKIQIPVPTALHHEGSSVQQEDHLHQGLLPTLSPKGNMSRLQGNRMAISIFFDEYKNQVAGLEAIRGGAKNLKRVLEDKLKFRYKFPSESDPTLFEPHQFENQRKLVATFKEFLEKWTERQPKGTVVDTFLLYVHGHGIRVLQYWENSVSSPTSGRPFQSGSLS